MKLTHQFLRFAAVGATGTLIQYGILWLGVESFHISAPLASGTGYVFGSVSNYLLNYSLTFRGAGRPLGEAASKYFTILGAGWCINAFLMTVLVSRWGANYWAAQLLATAFVLLWNFCGSRMWAFKAAE
jgi:putative flippase GtrA